MTGFNAICYSLLGISDIYVFIPKSTEAHRHQNENATFHFQADFAIVLYIGYATLHVRSVADNAAR